MTTEESSPSPFVLGAPRGPPAARPGAPPFRGHPSRPAPGREDAGLGPAFCRPLLTPLLSFPAAPRAAASCWGGGRRPAPAAASPSREAWGLGLVPGRPGNGGAPAAALRSPPRTAPRLVHSPHACTLLAGGDAALRRAGAQSDGHALPRQGRAPAAARPVHTRGTRARTAHTRTHNPRTRDLNTRARTPTYARPCTPGVRCPTPATGGPSEGPWDLLASVVTPYPFWFLGGRGNRDPSSHPDSTAPTLSCLVRSA